MLAARVGAAFAQNHSLLRQIFVFIPHQYHVIVCNLRFVPISVHVSFRGGLTTGRGHTSRAGPVQRKCISFRDSHQVSMFWSCMTREVMAGRKVWRGLVFAVLLFFFFFFLGRDFTANPIRTYTSLPYLACFDGLTHAAFWTLSARVDGSMPEVYFGGENFGRVRGEHEAHEFFCGPSVGGACPARAAGLTAQSCRTHKSCTQLANPKVSQNTLHSEVTSSTENLSAVFADARC